MAVGTKKKRATSPAAKAVLFQVWLYAPNGSGMRRYYSFLGKSALPTETDKVVVYVPSQEHTYSVHQSAVGAVVGAMAQELGADGSARPGG